jgi:hypothetical protein
VIADIAHGHDDIADPLFLAAAIVAVVASWNAWPQRKLDGTLGWLSVALIAVAWLLL